MFSWTTIEILLWNDDRIGKEWGYHNSSKKEKVKKRKKPNKDKENTRPLEPLKETKLEKESRIQKETSNKIDK